jgi:hypothetical protein
MISNKGQGLSLNTVIIAILVLIVLVVVVLIFTGYFSRMFAPGVQSCTSRGGVCQIEGNSPDGDECNTESGDSVLSTYASDSDAVKAGCINRDEVCCRKDTGIQAGSPI